MYKVALISDAHFGIKKANDIFLQNQLNFFVKEFIPYLEQNGIKTIFVLGDLLDNRTHLNIKVKNVLFDLFNIISSKKFTTYIILGNHDIYYNSNRKIHSLKWLTKFQGVNVIEDIQIINLGANKDILLVPWIIKDEFISYLNNNIFIPKICFGHFEVIGFKFNKFKINDTGLNPDIFFKNFDLVFSGHFHTRSHQDRQNKKVVYIGAPYHLTRSDIGEERGFCVLDLDTNIYEYINNKNSIKYISVDYPQKITENYIKGNIVDVYVKYDKDYDEVKVHEYISKIESFGPINPPTLKIINSFNTNVDISGYDVKSATELMKEYILSLNLDTTTDDILNLMQKLYDEGSRGINL